MQRDIKLPWITLGYQVFAAEGPSGLKTERLAKKVGKNKSSFYHLFADLNGFTQSLLEYHLAQAKIMAAKEATCKDLPQFIDIILEHKTDLLFNRQLRIHRDNPAFEQCFCQTNEMTVQSIIPIWTTILDLQENSYLAGLVLKLSMENFYLQITADTLNREWLNHYFQELRALVRAFKAMPAYQ